MNKLVLWIFWLIPCVVFSQALPATEQEKAIDEKAQLIKKYFNTKAIDSLYILMAPSFQKMVNQKTLEQGLITQLGPYGAITEYVFEKNTNGVSKYRTKHSAGLMLQTMIGIDSTGLVNTFTMQPYKDESIPKRTELASDNPMLTQLDSVVDKICRSYIMDTTTKGISIGVSLLGKKHLYHYGEADKAKDIKVGSQTVYEIGSVSKTFTAYLLAQAVAKQKISLADPITKYLPDSVAANEALQKIQVIHLANHSSGLPRLPINMFAAKGTDLLDPYALYNTDYLMKSLKIIKPYKAPGEVYEYSNYAVGLLGFILEQIYHMPYDDMVAKYITKPLKMDHTSSANIIFPTQAIGYNEKEPPLHTGIFYP